MHLVVVGGSDAGISAALRARELDAAAIGRPGPASADNRIAELVEH